MPICNLNPMEGGYTYLLAGYTKWRTLQDGVKEYGSIMAL